MWSSAKRRLRRSLLALGGTALLIGAAPAALQPLAPTAASAVQDIVWYQQCSNGGTSMLAAFAESGFSANTACPAAGTGKYRGAWIYGSQGTPGHHVAHWEVDAPPNMAIVMAHVPEMADSDGSYGWGQFFYWDSGSSGWLTNLNGGAGAWPSTQGWQSFSPSRYFGWELACNAPNTGCNSADAYVDVFDLQLEAYEYQTPNIFAGPVSGGHNLWYQAGGWVHGSLPIDLQASDPTGVCRVVVWWNGHDVLDTGERPASSASWDQCDPNHAPNSPQNFFTGSTINTTTDVPGSATGVQLAIQAHNASYNPSTGAPDWTSDVESLNVDNLPVSLSLTGPTDVPVTAGTQYVTATASSGPSGVGAIMCSVDGSAWTAQRLTGAGGQAASASVPVNGLGSHTVSCYAANQAVDGSGAPTASPTQTWSLKLGEPVKDGITFAKVVRDCRRVRERVRKRVRHVLRCQTRTPERRIQEVALGRRVTVRGWFATADGTALGHVPVSIMAAVDDGFHEWRRVSVVNTSADGSWRATLPPGPSRLVEAVYGGGPFTESAVSPLGRVMVPAKIRLEPVSAHVPWGGVLVVRGRVLGGFIPPEQILQMRSGVGKHLQVIGNPYIHGDGRFVIRLAATGSGGPLTTQIAVATLRETNYPYARGYSRRIWITIG